MSKIHKNHEETARNLDRLNKQETDEIRSARYERTAAAEWGQERVGKSIRLWNSYSEDKQKIILEEGDVIYTKIVELMFKDPGDPEVQQWILKWHEYMYYFFEPSLEVLRGLGVLYETHQEFRQFFERFHPELPNFLNRAIDTYVEMLEERWLQQQYGILQE